MAGIASITASCIDVMDRVCVDVCEVQCICEFDAAEGVPLSDVDRERWCGRWPPDVETVC